MITVVSGLPRSGTSLMMQMLAAAGIPIQQDGIRKADRSNARGYFEWERIKQLPREPALIAACEGKAVKVISSLLPSLPEAFDYRIIFMERDLADVVASQARLIERLGTRGAGLSPERMRQALSTHREQVYAWLTRRGCADRPAHSVSGADDSSAKPASVIKVGYEQLLEHPAVQAARVGSFLGLDDAAARAMAGIVDPELHHERRGGL